MMQESHFEGSKSSMNTRILKIRHHIDSLTKYLAPLLPIANCHMVEFLTQNHWDGLLPDSLRDTLNGLQLNEALEQFWTAASDKEADNSILSNWIHTARSHCVSVNNDYCLSAEQLRERIRSWGGEIKPEIRVKEFMTSKKSYEV